VITISLPLKLTMPLSLYNPLEHYWPYEMNTNLEWCTCDNLHKSSQIGLYDSTRNGFTILTNGDQDPNLLLPIGYKNGFRLMNAKISFLQQCVAVFSEPPPKSADSSGLTALRLARDSALRNLQFSITVREQFLSELSRRQRAAFRKNFRSRIMDAWLYCEFRWGRHDPAYVLLKLRSHNPKQSGDLWKLKDDGECQLSG
jgi:hypothetical protein